MSTSCSATADLAKSIQPFSYAELSVTGDGEVSKAAAFDGKVSSEMEKREAAARTLGRQEGEEFARAGFEQELARERSAMANALQSFAQEREQYFQRIEAEVVQLSLSIARKILHRESQVDPSLLSGMVRVLLEKLEAGSQVVVRVHAGRSAAMREWLAQQLEASVLPEVIDDPNIAPDRCVVQTALGTTELGTDVQLKEIERGLLDLLAQRPTEQEQR
jgi:flagellar assembly protein FliH